MADSVRIAMHVVARAISAATKNQTFLQTVAANKTGLELWVIGQ